MGVEDVISNLRRIKKQHRLERYLEGDNSHLRYEKPWAPDFPFCTACGCATACLKGTCGNCLSSRMADKDRLWTLCMEIFGPSWDDDEVGEE